MKTHMRTTPKPKTKTRYVNFLLSPDEKKDFDNLPRMGADAAGLIRVSLHIMDEQAERIEKIQVQQSRRTLTSILVSNEDKALVERLAKRNKVGIADVIRYAIHALHTRGLRFG